MPNLLSSGMTWQRIDVLPLCLLYLMCWSVSGAHGRQFAKCEFAQLMRSYFAEEEVAAWTCIAQFESEFKTDAINPSNSDGSSDHGIFQINDRYWCGSSGSNTCGVDCSTLRQDDLSESVRCAQIVKHKQGFTAWVVWPKCKGQTATYLDDCNDQSFLPPTIFDIQVRPANRGPSFNQTTITSSLKAFPPSKNAQVGQRYSSFNDNRPFNLTSFGGMDFLGGGRFLFSTKSPLKSNEENGSRIESVTSRTSFLPTNANANEATTFSSNAQTTAKTYRCCGYLHHSDLMSFLGFPGSQLSFARGSRLSSDTAAVTTPRQSGLLNAMRGVVGHAYNTMSYPTGAPIKRFTYRTGQALLANNGAMNFLGGIQGIPFHRFRTTPSSAVSTTGQPATRPLAVSSTPKLRASINADSVPSSFGHLPQIQTSISRAQFQTGFVRNEIVSAPRSVSPVYRKPMISAKLTSANRGAFVSTHLRGTNGGEILDYAVNIDRRSRVSSQHEKKTTPSSRVHSTRLPTLSTGRVLSSSLNYAPSSPLFQKGVVQRSSVPATSQLQAPSLSYSTGTTFFRLGASAIKSDSTSGSGLSGYLPLPKSTSLATASAQSKSDQSRTLRRNFAGTSPNPAGVNYPQQARRIVESAFGPQITLTPSAARFRSVNDGNLRQSLRPTRYDYKAKGFSTPNAQLSTVSKLATIDPSVRAFRQSFHSGAYRNAPLQTLTNHSQSGTGASARVSSSRIRSPMKRFVPVEKPTQLQLFSKLPQQVQNLMPDGYGGVSYTMKDGRITMVQYYG